MLSAINVNKHHREKEMGCIFFLNKKVVNETQRKTPHISKQPRHSNFIWCVNWAVKPLDGRKLWPLSDL